MSNFSFSLALHRTLSLVQRDMGLLVPGSLIWAAALTMVNVVLEQVLHMPPNILGFVMNFAVTAFFTSCFTYAAVNAYTPPLREALDIGSRAFWTVLLAAGAATLITGLGFMMLVLPGLAAIVFLWMLVPVILAERPSFEDTFRRSVDLTKQGGWAFAGFVLAVLAVSLIVSAILIELVTSLSGLFLIGLFLSALVEVAADVFSLYSGAAAYLMLSGSRPGDIAGEFD